MSTEQDKDPAARNAAPDATAAATAIPETTAADAPDPSGGSDSSEALRREKDALHDRLLRTAAEFDNYRKRQERERAEFAAYTTAEVLREVLPIVDNIERALQAPASPEAEAYRKGVELIHRQLLDLLKKRGVTPIEAVGATFDPNFHEAVVQEESADHREGEVIAELQKGYLLGERLLRPAMVKVAKA